MELDKLKSKASEVIPYVAVFGVAALAVYGITKVFNSAKNIEDRKSTRLNSSHTDISRMPSSA